jgi:hypothetical protein
VVVAVGGGAWALKDKLLGKDGRADTTATDTSRIALNGGTNPGGGPTVDSLKQDSLDRLSHQTNGGATNPNVRTNGGKDTTLGRDIATKPIGTVDDRPGVTLPRASEATHEDPSRRDAARRKAISIYYRGGLSDSIRASAALLIMGAYTEDGKYQSALDWADSSYRLRPDTTLLKQINVLKQLLGN